MLWQRVGTILRLTTRGIPKQIRLQLLQSLSAGTMHCMALTSAQWAWIGAYGVWGDSRLKEFDNNH